MAVVGGRSTGSLEGMPKSEARLSINRHFQREGVIQAAVTIVPFIIAIAAALVLPWLFEHFQ